MSSDNELSAQSCELQGLTEKVHGIAQSRGPVSIAVVNRKGGVGKSSIVTNMATELARRGLKVLIMGLCGQAGIGTDLGVMDQSDDGLSVAEYVKGLRDDITVVPSVRPNLDMIFGGTQLTVIETLVGENAKMIPGGDPIGRFTQKMLEKFDPYDVVIMDFPPQQTVTQLMGFSVTDWVLIPTINDGDSMNGVSQMPALLETAYQLNPDIRMLGIVLFGHDARATTVHREWQEDMAKLAPNLPLMSTYISYSKTFAVDCRNYGMVSREMVSQPTLTNTERIAAIKRGERPPRAIAKTALRVVDQYEALTLEVITKIVEAYR